MEQIVESIVNILSGDIAAEWIVFIVSMLPIVELRGGILAASLLGVEMWKAFLICAVGTMIPVPFILLFIRQILTWLKNMGFAKFAEKLEAKAEKNRAKVEKYETFGLTLFVGVPLPGTGAWTGSLIAALMNMRFKHAFLAVLLGTLLADAIMCLISYGVLGAIF